LLFLHSIGRVGCYFADCCGGIFYTFNLHFVAIFFYFFAALLGFFLKQLRYLVSFYTGLLYYVVIIFLERFVFDIYRFDAIFINNFFTKYQIVAMIYLFLCFLSLFVFYKKTKL
jgi:hypothetical protein